MLRPNDPKDKEKHEKWNRKGDQDPGRIHQKGVTENDTKNDDNQIYLPTPPPGPRFRTVPPYTP